MAQMAVCHIEKCSGKCSTKMEQEEERHKEHTPNADKKRKHLNFSIHLDDNHQILFDKLRWSGLSKQERIDARLAMQKAIQITDKNGRTYTKSAKIRKDAVTHFNLILSGTHERLDELFQVSRAMVENGIPMEGAPIGKWAKDNYLWLAEKAGGAENIVTFCVHLDESTPHIQATICPMYDGRLNSKKFVDGPNGLQRMQTEYADKVSRKWGLDRGVQGSKAKHQKLAEFYRRQEEASRTPGDAEAIEVDGKQFESKAPQITTRPPRLGNMDKWIAEENERLAKLHRKNTQEIIEKTKEMLQQQVDADNRHYYEVQNTSLKMVRQNYRQLAKNSQLKGQIDTIAELRAKEMTETIKEKAHEEIQAAKIETKEEIDAARRNIREEIEAKVNQKLNDLVGPTLNQVWGLIDMINGENSNLDNYESWEDYFYDMRTKLRQANDSVHSEREKGGAEYQRKIFPLLRNLWQVLGEVIGTKEKLPRKADDILVGILNRLMKLKNEVLPTIIKKEVSEEMEKFELKINQKIKQLESDLAKSENENNSLTKKLELTGRMVAAFADSNATIQAGRKAIYSLSTTSGQKKFTPQQAEDVMAAICLGKDQDSRQSIADFLLDDVANEIRQMSSTYVSWYEKFAQPETLSILESVLLNFENSNGVGIGGGGAKDLSKKKKRKDGMGYGR